MDKPIDQIVGERVRFFRLSLGMKQKELAQKLGVSYQQVQKYESGKDKISIARLMDISSIFSLSPTVFIDFDGETASGYNRQTLGMMKNFSRIESEKERQAIVDIIKVMSDRY